jgi:RecG-like helicase
MKLTSPLTAEFRLLEVQKKALSKMGIATVEDLLYYFPVRYGNTSQMQNVETLTKGDDATVFGKISGLKTSKAFVKKIPMAEATVTDDTGHIKIVWFNQPYIAKMIHEGQLVRVEGKVTERKSKGEAQRYMSNPKIEVVDTLPTAVGESLFAHTGTEADTHVLYPVYPESKGVTSLDLPRHATSVFERTARHYH